METMRRLISWLADAAREHWLPALLLAAPINLAIWTENMLAILLVLVTAFVIGAALQPRHIWVVWLASVVTLWIAAGVWEIFNDPAEPANPENEETIVSFLFESFIFMAVGVLLPCWVGRLIGGDDMQERRRDDTRGNATF
jgi:hypothetical protein